MRTKRTNVKVSRYLRRAPEPKVSYAPLGMGRPSLLPGVSRKEMVDVLTPHGAPESEALMKFGIEATREHVASTIDDLLGFDVVPKTQLRMVLNVAGDPETASVQTWVKDAVPFYRFDGKAPPNEQFMQLAVLDIITGNSDRHVGNILVQRGRGKRPSKLWAVDNAFAFPLDVYVRIGHDVHLNPRVQTFDETWYESKVAGKPVPAATAKAINDIEEGDLRAALAPLNDKIRIEGAVWRWKKFSEWVNRHGKFPQSYEWRQEHRNDEVVIEADGHIRYARREPHES